LQANYPKYFAEIVSSATPVYGEDVVQKAYNIDGDVRIEYSNQGHFEQIVRKFGIFEEWKV